MLNVVELFAGIGGLTQGFLKAKGYKSVLLTDINEAAHLSYRLNYPDAHYELADVRDLDGRSIREKCGTKVQGLIGCPPCQGFSAAGSRNAWDGRNRLVQDFFRLIRELRPSFFLFENVPQVCVRRSFRRLLRDFAQEEGYATWCRVVNAAMYGVPQTRQRAILIGLRSRKAKEIPPPAPTHWGAEKVYEHSFRRMISPTGPNATAVFGPYPNLPESAFWTGGCAGFESLRTLGNLQSLVTVGEALRDLGAPNRDHGFALYEADQMASEYALSLRNGLPGVFNHAGWNHRIETKAMMRAIPPGGARFADPGDGRSRRYYSQAYARLHERGLARTITSQFHNPGCGRYIHFRKHRTLTVREAARLQGIDDPFMLAGTLTQQEALVGNAFPVPWATAMAKHILTLL